MKKAICFLSIFTMLFVLSACDNTEFAKDVDTSISITQNQIILTESSNPTESSEPTKTSKPVESGKLVTSTHTHSFSKATCTVPAKCSCGVTEGKALGHNYSEATCTDAKKCTRCDATDGNALGHSYSDATCIAAAECTRCGITSGSANGHSWMEATYDTPKTCSVCKTTEGEPLTKPNSENYHGHVYTGGSTSKKYHYEANCAGKNSHEITWDEVSKRKLGPCGTCVLK